ncbi:rRNA-processing protein bfr2 [Amphichorda felina]
MAKLKGRANLFEDDEHIVKDYDPEAEGRDVESDSGSEAGETQNAGTEHYEAVGKSKLREKDAASLGPQYRGSKVSRAALEQESDEEEEDENEDDGASSGSEEYADPDLVNLEADEAKAGDSEIDSDDALAESDEDRFKDFAFRGSSKPAKPKGKRATAADFMSSSDEEDGAEVDDDEDEDALDDMDDSEMDDSGDDEDMDDGLDALVDGGASSEEEDGSEMDDEEGISDEEDEDDESESEDEGDRPSKKGASGPKAPGAASANADVQKGLAIQQQRKIYDGLLNLRIRLQKALVAANTFPAIEDGPEGESEPYEAAEEAAVKLLNTISGLKFDFGPSAQAGSKRKRTIDASTPSDQIWEQLQADEKRISKARKSTLEKWSQKVRAVNDLSGKKSLTSNLEEQLANTEYRLVKRTQVPRSCAPAQAAKRVAEDENIYDDADFYQQLLKELVDQRTVDTAGDQSSAVPSVMLTASKDIKMRKAVDRKASKGRKMRFTVHEKLQNFMAPEDRRSWEQGAIDRFFGTLFGQKMELNEEESEDEDMEGLSANAEGLRLFV